MIKKIFKIIIVLAVILIILTVGGYMAICRLFPIEHYDIIEKYSNEYNLDPALICAIINTESHFREDVESHKGASGLMQLMEPTADWVAEKMGLEDYSYDEVKDPETNIMLGCWLLNKLYTMYEDENAVIAAYNAGTGNVRKWLKDPMYSGDGIHLTAIPFAETENYVKKVKFYQKIYDIMLEHRTLFEYKFDLSIS
jgi:soluble lytic murein transglycosylase